MNINMKNYLKEYYPTLSRYYNTDVNTFNFTKEQFNQIYPHITAFIEEETKHDFVWAIIYNINTELYSIALCEPDDNYKVTNEYTFKI